MKKLILTLCAAALVVVCVALVAACSDKSVQSDAPEAHTHVFGTYIVTKYPTCTEAGTKTAYCVCHAQDTVEIPPLGHELEGLSCQGLHCVRDGCDYAEPPNEHSYTAVTVTPDCTEGGYTVYQCKCGASYVGNEVAATGHRWSEWSVREAPNCTESGREYRYCEVCPAYEFRSVEPTGHYYTVVQSTEAGCTEPGVSVSVCAICGDEVRSEIPCLGHDWVKTEEIAPTCHADGLSVYECTRCHEQKSDDFTDKLTHVFESDAYLTPCVAHKCLNPGCDYETTPVAHDLVPVQSFPATCTEPAETLYVCSRCGAEERVVDSPAKGHSFKDVPLSCDKVCEDCGYTEKHDHALFLFEQPPSCTEDGFYEYRCSECGYTAGATVIPATGHVFGEERVCGEQSCLVCGKTETVPHSYEETVVKPTCVSEGYTEYICSACGDSYRDDFTEKTPHVYDGIYGVCECGKISGTYRNVASDGGIILCAEVYTEIAVADYYAFGVAIMAFAYNPYIVEVYFGPFLSYIDSYAFYECGSLKKIFVPEDCAIAENAIPEGTLVVRVAY